MKELTTLVTITIGAILSNNFIFSQFLGCCPFMGVSKKIDTATGMGFAVVFVMGLASAITWCVYNWILVPLDLLYMETVAFILVIAALVQFIEMFLQKSVPSLYTALGVYLPLITTNCAVLGVALLRTPTTSLRPWSTALWAAWASCWRLSCWQASGSNWRSPTTPKPLTGSRLRW